MSQQPLVHHSDAAPATRVVGDGHGFPAAPAGFPQSAGYAQAGPTVAPAGYPAAGYPSAGYAPAGPPPRRRGRGALLGIGAGVLTLLGGAGTAALFLFGSQVIDPDTVEAEIVRVSTEQIGVAAEGVSCPDDVAAEAGATFTCSATVQAQPLTFTVTQDDADLNVTITWTRTLDVLEIETIAGQQLTAEVGEDVVVACTPEEQTVLVNEPGTPIPCVAAAVSDPEYLVDVTVDVAADGTVTVA